MSLALVGAGSVPSGHARAAQRTALAPTSDEAADERAEAGLQSYRDATSKYEKGDYAGAIQGFKASFDILGDPRLLYNIAVCHDRLDEFEEAAEYYERYKAVAPPEEHEAVEGKIANLTARSAAKRKSDAQRADESAVSVPPPPPASGLQPTDTGNVAGAPPGKVFGVAAAVLTGTAVAALGFGLGFGIAASRKNQTANDGCPDIQGERFCNDAGERDLQRARTFAIVADVSFAVGAALAVAAVAVIATKAVRRRRATRGTAARVTFTGSGLVGRF